MDAKRVDTEIEHKVRSLCADFLNGDWMTKKDFIEVYRLLSGNANRTFRCCLDKKRIIVKLYGAEMVERLTEINDEMKNNGNDIKESKTIGEAGTAVLMQILAKRNLAPKLLAVFPGGRIEEYISGRNLLIADFESKEMYSVVARTLANFHMTVPPISKKIRYLDVFEDFLKIFPEKCDYSAVSEDYREDVNELFALPITEEIKWIKEWARILRFKVVFSHNDLHLNNIILKSEFNSPENRLMFIDYDLCGYNYRGSDIAYFLQSFEFNVFAGVDKFSFNYTGRKCDQLMKRYFVDEYLTETKKLVHATDAEVDNVDFLLMEVDFFALQAYLVFLIFSRILIFDPKDKPFDHISPLLRCYKQQKQLLLSKYEYVFKNGNN